MRPRGSAAMTMERLREYRREDRSHRVCPSRNRSCSRGSIWSRGGTSLPPAGRALRAVGLQQLATGQDRLPIEPLVRQ